MYYNELDEEMQKTQGQDRFKLLRARVEVLMQNSKDAEFTVYLRQMQNRIANQERQVELLKEELDSRVKMYEHRMQMYQASQPAPQPVSQPAPMAAPMPQPVPQPAPMAAPAPQPAPQPAPIPPVRPQPQPAAAPARPKRSAEFIIGVAVLSVVGGVFILTAMVLLGMYFMEGLTKGLMLYVACIAVMVLAEAVLYRRWPGLGMTLSAIGMGGLYISTLINYLVLHNFHQWVALGLTLLITLTVILLSRKRDAAAYRILGMAAVYICMLLVPDHEILGGGLSMTEFLTATVMALAVNIMCLAVPVKKTHTGIHVTHMALNTAFTFIAYLKWTFGLFGLRGDFPVWQQPLFLAVSILVMHMIFVVQVRWQEKQTPGASMEQNMGICITYGISSLFYMLLVGLTTNFAYSMTLIELFGDEYLLDRLICSGVVVALCLIPMRILREKQEKWFIWYALNLWLLGIHVANGGDWEMALCLLVMLAASKILSFARRPMLYISDAVVTTFACMTVYFGGEYNYVIPLAVGLVLSILCLNYWHTYFQVILVFTIALYTSSHMLQLLKLPVFVGILFVGMLLFNNVDRWRGKGQSVVGFNALALGGQAICYLALINPVYRNAYLTYFCMLIFGTATIMICFQKKYYMDFGCKQLILAIFLTYMGLIVRTSYPITNSILLMLLALGCVAAGFAINKKSVRIYGLVLSLVICGKLVLYDFIGANILQKTILFFAVGLLALAIAAIYMILERNQEKRNENTIENANEKRDEINNEKRDEIGSEIRNEMDNEISKRSAE